MPFFIVEYLQFTDDVLSNDINESQFLIND